MKKGMSLLLGILFLLVPFIVSADMGAPEITSYEVRVVSASGTSLVDWKGNTIDNIAYDTVLKITMEEVRNGILYGGTEVNKKWGFVKLSDTSVIEKEFDLSKFTKAEKPQKRYVFVEGAYLYKGPSTIYGKVDEEVMIPKGTTISYEYSDDCWAYVECEGVKGWVYIYTFKDFGPYNLSSSLAYLALEKNNKILTLDDVELVDNPIHEEKTGIKIPANQEVTYDYYYYAHPKETYYHVIYGDKEGWIETKTSEKGKDTITASNKCRTIMIMANSVPLYKTYFEEESISKIEIPFGKELKVIYSAYSFEGENSAYGFDKEISWYYVEYDGHKGWIKDSHYDTQTQILDLNYGFVSNYTATSDIPLYEDLNNKEKSITLNKDSQFQVLYSYVVDANTTWLYVRDSNYKGWVLKGVNTKYETQEEVCIDIVAKGEIDPVEEKEKEDKKEQEDASRKERTKDSFSSKMILILCIGGSFALCIASTTTLVILHKKRKKKQETKETL